MRPEWKIYIVNDICTNLNWNPLRGDTGIMSELSDMDELGLGVFSGCRPFLIASTTFFTRPRLFSNFGVSIDVARRLDLPVVRLALWLICHHDDFPVPSFWIFSNRLCKDKLWRMEFCKYKNYINHYAFIANIIVVGLVGRNLH